MDADRHDDLLDELLAQGMAEAGCPDDERLAAFVDRALREADANPIAAHVVSCRRCRDDVAAVREGAGDAALSDEARRRALEVVEPLATPAPTPTITRLPRWVPAAVAAGLLGVVSTIALRSQEQTVDSTYVPVTGSGVPAATHHVAIDPVVPPPHSAVPAPATTTASPVATAVTPGPSPAAPAAPATSAPATSTATPTPPVTATPSAPTPPATTTPAPIPAPTPPTTAAPTTSAPVVPAGPTVPTPAAPVAPAAPKPAATVSLHNVQGKLAVRRSGADKFERARDAVPVVKPGDMLTPVNGKPVAFTVGGDVTVAIRSGARLSVSRVGDTIELTLGRGACAVETLGAHRPIVVHTSIAVLRGSMSKFEVEAGDDGLMAVVSEGSGVLEGGITRLNATPGMVIQARVRDGATQMRGNSSRYRNRWAESVMPSCDRHGRAGARCPVCIRAQQILDDRLARLGGGSKSRNRPGGEPAGEAPEAPNGPPNGPPPPPPPPGGGGGAAGGPPPPPPGGPTPPPAPPEEKPGEEKPTAPAPKPRTTKTPKLPNQFDLPTHLLTQPLPRCCAHGKGKCWQIVKKYGPALPQPWPVAPGQKKEKR